MLKFKDYLSEGIKVSKGQIKELEKVLDKLFAEINIDIEFSRHFFDRVNDSRNGEDIRVSEIRNLFRAEFKKYKKEFKGMKPDFQALLKDLQSNINIPFVISWDEKNKELDLTVKTIMRKKNFKTSNKVYAV